MVIKPRRVRETNGGQVNERGNRNRAKVDAARQRGHALKVGHCQNAKGQERVMDQQDGHAVGRGEESPAQLRNVLEKKSKKYNIWVRNYKWIKKFELNKKNNNNNIFYSEKKFYFKKNKNFKKKFFS